MHSSLFYQVTGAVLPVFLVAFGRAGRLRWPATATAAIYMAIVLIMIWTLEAFPATPKLAPIYNPVTHMVAPFFPLILVVPAIAIDLLLRRYRSTNDWLLAIALGVAFVALLLVVQWFWSEFLLSPGARNYVFASDQWNYNSRLGPWRYEYWIPKHRGSGSDEHLVRGLGVAMLLAIVSARLGLWWGEGMARLRR